MLPVATLVNFKQSSESKELIYLNSVKNTLSDCLQKLNITRLDEQLENCIRRIYARQAEEYISRKNFLNKIRDKYNISSENFEIIEGVIYVHP